MRELHVVALSEDGRHVVLATRAGAPSGEFRVALDERLTAAVRGELPAPGRDAPPSISPRDIQARLRDGQSPEEIAASAGVPLSRVERYAGPVLAELERVITGARDAVVSRPRLGASALPLGGAVEAHLAEMTNLAEGSVRWSARRTDLGRWVVEVSWTARGRRRTAGWHYDPATREVAAVDGPSAVLGHVEAEAAAAPGAGRSARPAAAVRGTGRASGSSRSSAPVAPGRSVRSPAASAAGTSATPAAAARSSPRATPAPAPAARAGATARTSTPRASTPPASTPAIASGAAPTRRRPATPPAAGGGPAAPRPAAKTSTRSAAARAGSGARSAPVDAVTGRARSRPTPSRRSAVPPLERQVAPERATTAPPAAPRPSPAAATTRTASPAPHQGQVPGPPVLRVVPSADPGTAQDAAAGAPPATTRPARRAAGQRAGGSDWADVLMGAAPAPPAAEPRQD